MLGAQDREQSIHNKFFEDYRSSVTAHDLMDHEQTDKVKELLGEFHLTTEVDKQRYSLMHDDLMAPFPELTFDFGVPQEKASPEDAYDCTPLFANDSSQHNLLDSFAEGFSNFADQQVNTNQQSNQFAESQLDDSTPFAQTQPAESQRDDSQQASQQDFFGKYFSEDNASPVQVTTLVG